MLEKKDNKIIADDWDEMGLDVPAGKLNSDTDIKIRHCPECRDAGKKKSNDFSVSLNPAKGVGHCFKCGVKYIIRKEQMSERVENKKTFTPPNKQNLTALSKDALQFFTNRRISQESISFFKVVQRKDWVAYPYFFNGELVNIKYKNIHEKKYTQSPGGMHVVFNYDEAKKTNVVIITEGEEECMCWFDAGFEYAVSVDAGAPNPTDKIEKKLECIDNSFDLFENADMIYIAVDNDANGRRLQEELIRRFQIEKVKLVDFGKHKDANDVVMYEGRDALKELIKSAKDVPMDGVFTVDDVTTQLWDNYNHGYKKGSTTHYPSIDKRWKWRPSEVTLVTGFANDGKSTLYNVNLPLMKSYFDGWKHGLFIPENFPAEEFFEEVIHCLIGKTTDKDYQHLRATEEEFAAAMAFIKEYFFLVYPEQNPTLEKIFERFDYLVRKHGLNTVIIDPYNSIEHLIRPGETIDQYVTRFMGMLRMFARKRNLCVILIAHQNPPKTRMPNGKDYPEPDMYTVKNGGSFADRTDNLVAIHRPTRFSDPGNALVSFISLKLKKKKLLEADTGSADILYNWKTNRFEDPELGNRSPLEIVKTHESVAVHDEEEIDLPF
jgi:twinkle protein